MTETLQQLLAVIAEVTDRDAGELDAESPLASAEINSLEEVHLMMLLEERFDIEVTLAQVKACPTLGDVSALLERLQTGKRPAV